MQGLRLKEEGGLQYWFKPLAGGDWAFCLFNRGMEPVSQTIDWQTLCFTDEEVSGLSTAFDTTVYKVRDLWAKPSKKKAKPVTTKKPLPVTVPGHDVILFRLTPVKK